jgi:hypothetical protein
MNCKGFPTVYPKNAVDPRKTRNKLACCVDRAIHPLGDILQLGISLNIFVIFVVFVDEMIFLGLSGARNESVSLVIITKHLIFCVIHASQAVNPGAGAGTA